MFVLCLSEAEDEEQEDDEEQQEDEDEAGTNSDVCDQFVLLLFINQFLSVPAFSLAAAPAYQSNKSIKVG